MTNDDWNKIAEMRTAQRSYFSTRSNYWLAQSKKLEKEVDQRINKHFSQHLQTDLFTTPNPKP